MNCTPDSQRDAMQVGVEDDDVRKEAAILASSLCKRYGRQLVLNGLTLSVNRGEVYGLLGPNGAGKTTTIELLLGLLPRTSGKLLVLGVDPSSHKRFVRSRIGYMMQRPSLDKLITGRENLRLFACLFNLPHKEREERVETALDWVGLRDSGDKRLLHYSGGMERRLDLAVAMLPNPELVILDEPTLGLDTSARRQVWDLIADLRKRGTTVFLTTHYLDEADRLCDRVAVISEGRNRATGRPAKLKRAVIEDAHQLIVYLSDDKILSLPAFQGVRSDSVYRDDRCGIRLAGRPVSLWRAFAALERQYGDQIASVEYREPTLDDVVYELTVNGSKGVSDAIWQ